MKFWRELLRRKVLRTAGLYIVGAWLVLQVADIFFPAWGLPETGIRYLFIAGAACFPVALVFGWFYDITPRGIVRTEPARRAEAADLRLKRADYLVLVALFGISAVILYGSLGKIKATIEASPGPVSQVERLPNSIAVLPFTNLDVNEDTGYFSDGITEEILHRLSTMRVLHVLASNSSFALRDSESGPAGISEMLGVHYLLQGSVRRDQDNVRITARLVDKSGFQLWSDTFDRQLESIFVIQSEIASIVSTQILNEIVPPQELPAGRTTENMEAYNAFLQGWAYFQGRTENWREHAEKAFRRAIQLDPGYAPPYAGLATLVVSTNIGPHWEEARDFAEKALELDPELPLGHATHGLTLSVLGDHERGSEALHRAIDLDPSMGTAYAWIGHPLLKLGLEEERREMLRRGLEVDPLNPVLLQNSSNNASNLGDFERAEQLLMRLTRLPEPPQSTYLWLYSLYDEWGDYAAAVEAIKDDIRLDPSRQGFRRLALAYAQLGMIDDANYWMGEFRSLWSDAEPEPPLGATLEYTKVGGTRWLAADLQRAEEMLGEEGEFDTPYLLSYGGLAWIQAGEVAKGIQWLKRGLVLYQQEMARDDAPDQVDFSLLKRNWSDVLELAEHLAFAYRESGRNREARKPMAYIEGFLADTAAWTQPQIVQTRALFRALSGDPAGALEHLQKAKALGKLDYYRLVNDRLWSKTIQAPEFRQLLEAAKAEIQKQRAEVEAAEAEQDFRVEIAMP